MSSNTIMEKQPLLSKKRRPLQHDEPEPTLSELEHNVYKAQKAYFKAWCETTSGRTHTTIMFTVAVLLGLFFLFGVIIIAFDTIDGFDGDNSADDHGFPVFSKKIPLEAHIMSKCPDAKDCLHDMILPAMVNISDKVDFRLSYIGSVTDDQDGVECMHGPDECLGNMLELCAAKEYPDPRIFLGFTWCLTRNYQDIPKRDLVEDCALEHGISLDRLNDCTVEDDGVKALRMLQASFNRTIDAGVTKSCTVRLNGKIRCIRDGGEWSDCEQGSSAEDLVKDVLSLYRRKNTNENGWFA